MLKILFALEVLTFFSRLFGYIQKMLDKKSEFNSEI